MEVFGLVKMTEEESPTVLPVQDIQVNQHSFRVLIPHGASG